jgi:hypothetical protein
MRSAGDEDPSGAGKQHSLAHELAAALMPEPSAGSKLLAEEFGIEYDEGAEGIDESSTPGPPEDMPISGTSFADELGGTQFDPQSLDPTFGQDHTSTSHLTHDDSADFGSPTKDRVRTRPAKDPMDVLAQDIASTDSFLSSLRSIDSHEAGGSSIEELALEVVKRMEENARDREGQVRQLFQFDREFKKMAAEIGGMDVLGQLDALEDLHDEPSSAPSTLPTLTEEAQDASLQEDYELDPDHNRLGDGEDDEFASSPVDSPTKPPFGSTKPSNSSGKVPSTPSASISQLSQFRTFNSSLLSSLSSISEQVQENGQATTDASRKIRALKNRLTTWQNDRESAEKSMLKIERYEAGLGNPVAIKTNYRSLVEEHLKASEKAIAEAGIKTQAIMAM